ncbi:3521_t:CDS:2 [Acaulospora colombiana]|uniref:3521_t:CDS:1 n=1 Tax=Acaulospora colombiana TaxID=27376 RepID=A0ACA9K0Y0_9GLOM|nr:3521_t:CDS:2 [Acaulospora colombiana]
MAEDTNKIPLVDHAFVESTKKISDEKDVVAWINSEAFSRLMRFIENLNESVMNKKISDPCLVTELPQKIINSLNTLKLWVEEIPPLPTPQRFGNKAFREWVARLEKVGKDAVTIHQNILPSQYHSAIVELVPYLVGSFGNGTRIDYGSGHELSFVAWLCCLSLLGALREQDNTALVLRRVYMLEPAGSHGVWGLDDHQFLSYYWGSAQLRGSNYLEPKSILSGDLVNENSSEYIYFGCIKYIHEVHIS